MTILISTWLSFFFSQCCQFFLCKFSWLSPNLLLLTMQLAATEMLGPGLAPYICKSHKTKTTFFFFSRFCAYARTGRGKKSTEVVYTLFLKTVPFIKVQPGGMVLQQCPISRGKKKMYIPLHFN